MLKIRRSETRGHANHGWLDSHHTFSFAGYYDPVHMGYGSLRVINEDRVQPGAGFPTHAHEDMEIVTYVLDGALEHKDSLGTGSVIRPGDVQRMSAGTGVRHSEYNASQSEGVHFLQIWIIPNRNGLPPSYEQKHFSDNELRGNVRPIATPDGREGSVKIHQDAAIYAGRLDKENELRHVLKNGRKAYLQIARGNVDLNGQALSAGDGAEVENESALHIRAKGPAEIILFDLV